MLLGTAGAAQAVTLVASVQKHGEGEARLSQWDPAVVVSGQVSVAESRPGSSRAESARVLEQPRTANESG